MAFAPHTSSNVAVGISLQTRFDVAWNCAAATARRPTTAASCSLALTAVSWAAAGLALRTAVGPSALHCSASAADRRASTGGTTAAAAARHVEGVATHDALASPRGDGGDRRARWPRRRRRRWCERAGGDHGAAGAAPRPPWWRRRAARAKAARRAAAAAATSFTTRRWPADIVERPARAPRDPRTLYVAVRSR